jgi:hypothetical protein
MAFNNIDDVALGNLLQIKFSDGIRNQISKDFRDWEMVLKAKVSNSAARELRFMLLTAFGVDAISYANPGTIDSVFPSADRSSLQEYTAKFKEVRATIEVQYDLFERAIQSPEKYGEPIKVEMDSKLSASKRRLAADFHADGTGVLGTVSASQVLANAQNIAVALDSSDAARGHVGLFEYGQKVVARAANSTGTAATLVTGTLSHFVVLQKDRQGQELTLQAINTAGVAADLATGPAAGEVLYRKAQADAGDIPNLTSTGGPGLPAPITDYGTATQVMAGLPSLVAADGRTIHGMQMSGAIAGSELNAGGNPIDVRHIQRAMSQVKVKVGQDQYSWKMMVQAPETLDSLIESRETDRRFMSMEDGARGTKKFIYQHQNDSLECYTSEYCQPKRIYILPESKSGQKVLEFHGSDFKTVKAPGGGDFHLKPTAAGFVATVVSYMQAIGVVICKHPASVAVIRNFTNS